MEFRFPVEVLAVKDTDAAALRRAASGGAFSVLARPIIAAGGIVFAARMDEEGTVRHSAARTLGDLPSFQGSAYVQSDLNGIFNQIAASVRAGIPTLFVGTPCQCASVLSYLKLKKAIRRLEDCGNLFLCDLICHGAPNNALFKAHQEWLSLKVGADDGIHSFRFRSKNKGWGLYYYYYYYKDGKKIEVCEPGECDPYYSAFLRGESYRECCYRCPFSRPERLTDFTIGDYWGIESAHPGFFDAAGVSVVLLNSEKGRQYFYSQAASGCKYLVSDFESAAKSNHNLNKPTVRPSSRDHFLSSLKNRMRNNEMDALFEYDLHSPKSIKSLVKSVMPLSFITFLKRAKGGLSFDF